MLKLALVAIALWIFAAPVSASEPRPFVQGEATLARVTGCDTLEQAMQALAAWQDGFAAFHSWMVNEGHVRNAINQPICGNVSGPMAPVELHGEFEREHQGETVTVYLIEFDLGGPSLFVLSPRAMIPKGDNI